MTQSSYFQRFIFFVLSAFLASSISIAETAITNKVKPTEVLPLEDLRTFAEVFHHIRSAYVEEVDDETLLEYAIQGMLAGLDPHSVYLNKNAFQDLRESTQGEFGGLGMEVGMMNGYVEIIAPIDDTPAKRAGLKSGDLILKIDGTPLKGISLTEAIDMMRGEIGSPIELTVLRQGKKEPFDVNLVRDIIKVKSVRSRELEPGYLYVRLAQFQSDTGKEFKQAIEKHVAKHPNVKGLIIDLRNNPGGILQAAVDVVDTVLSQGKIVYTEGRMPSAASQYFAKGKDLLSGKPIVVLMNGGSASASEIVAGALQDNQRAVIMGTDSFGKGSVQTVLELNKDRAVKLTTARYFTPSGNSIQAQGISPDIYVEKAQLTTIEEANIKEANLQGHLDNTNHKKHNSKRSNLLDSDNQLYEALNLLKGLSLVESRKKRS